MVAPIALYGYLSPVSGAIARAAFPVADAADPRDPQPRAPRHSASTVALAPAAMAALIEAQETLSNGAPAADRQTACAHIDRLIDRLSDGRMLTPPAVGERLATLRRLETARAQLGNAIGGIQA